MPRRVFATQYVHWTATVNNWTDEEYTLLESLAESNEVKYMVIGKEVGEQGTPHLQIMFSLVKKKRRDQVAALLPHRWNEEQQKDVPIWFEHVMHGDINMANYCKEDGDYREWGVCPVKKNKPKGDSTYSDAFNAPTVREGMAIVRAQRPRDAAIHGLAIEKNLSAARAPLFKPEYTLDDFNKEPLVLDKSMLVWGPSGLGKSQYVLAHFKNPLVITHMDGLRTLSPDHDAIVFDDMSFSHYPIETVIHLLDIDLPRDIHIRYGTAHIPAHTVKVFTHNTFNPFYKVEADQEQQNAVERRLKRFNVTQQLF
jgi:hypothetical protein